MKQNVADQAKKMSNRDLLRVARRVNRELLEHMLSGARSTQAHAGMLEMAEACANELVARGQGKHGAFDGSDLPVDVNVEDGQRLSFSVRVF